MKLLFSIAVFLICTNYAGAEQTHQTKLREACLAWQFDRVFFAIYISKQHELRTLLAETLPERPTYPLPKQAIIGLDILIEAAEKKQVNSDDLFKTVCSNSP